MKRIFSLITSVALLFSSYAQDTFSIVAMDDSTGEVGSAGASCVNMYLTGISDNSFLGELFPGVGAINCQAWYVPANQANARDQMNLGQSPDSIISWLVANDVDNDPTIRQYGIVALVDSSLEAAAYTGNNTDDYKGHRVGPNYSIQGNILSGAAVLDSMEARFLREDGDLACKLMAAMLGANTIGADSRCAAFGTSSLFAFLKVAQPTDAFGSPSLNVSMRSTPNQGVEPIDSLQVLFDAVHLCDSVPVDTTDTIPSGMNRGVSNNIRVYPNPSKNIVYLETSSVIASIEVLDLKGRRMEVPFSDNELDISALSPGVYNLTIRLENGDLHQENILKER